MRWVKVSGGVQPSQRRMTSQIGWYALRGMPAALSISRAPPAVRQFQMTRRATIDIECFSVLGSEDWHESISVSKTLTMWPVQSDALITAAEPAGLRQMMPLSIFAAPRKP